MTPDAMAWIDDQRSDLVAAAERFVLSSDIALPPKENDSRSHQARHRSSPHHGTRRPKARVSRSQLRNLLNVSISERSLPVLKNFLRYQIGRQSWKDQPSGDALLMLLDKEVAERATKGADGSDVSARVLQDHLAPLLIGYIVREYTYQCKEHGTSTDD